MFSDFSVKKARKQICVISYVLKYLSGPRILTVCVYLLQLQCVTIVCGIPDGCDLILI